MTLFYLLVAQFMERLAFLGVSPHVIGEAVDRGVSESTALFWLSLFMVPCYSSAFLLAPLVGQRGRPHQWAAAGALILALGYASGLSAQTEPIAFVLLPVGFGFFRLGLAPALGSACREPARAFWLQFLAVNLAAVLGPGCSQLLVWQGGVASACGCAAVAALLGAAFARMASTARKTEPAVGGGMHGRTRTAIGCLALAGLAAWLAALQPGTSLSLVASDRYLQLDVLGLRLGPGWFSAIHAALVVGVSALCLAARVNASVPRAFGSLLLAGVGFLILSLAFWGAHGPVSSWWLIACYVFLSIGEPFVHVAGLSALLRLAPAHRRSWVMGLWYGSVGLGLGLGALWGLAWDLGPSRYFLGLAIVLLSVAALLLRHARSIATLLGERTRRMRLMTLHPAYKRTFATGLLALTAALSLAPEPLRPVGLISFGLSLLTGGAYLIGDAIELFAQGRLRTFFHWPRRLRLA